jgi:hypothetical protein
VTSGLRTVRSEVVVQPVDGEREECGRMRVQCVLNARRLYLPEDTEENHDVFQP